MINSYYKVAITGASGLIGSRVIELLKKDFIFLPLKSTDIDITNRLLVEQRLSSLDFDLLLHLAAYTNVDEAVKNKELAYKVNVEGTNNLFQAVNNLGKKFIYISTDHVFSGQNPPYTEDSQPDPINYYGWTKYKGEEIVKGKAMIIRTSYPYRQKFAKKKDFVRVIRERLETNMEVTMATDCQITPTFIDDFVFGLAYLLKNFQINIYHLVGSESLSPFTSGKKIASKFGLNDKLIKPITYEAYFSSREKRPKYSIIKSKNNHFFPMSRFLEKW